MRLSALTATFVLATLGLCEDQASVNFYYDLNCQEYAGNIQIKGSHAEMNGGPYGSQSGMFISLPRKWNFWGFESAQGGDKMPYPTVWTPTQPGQCVSMPNVGIYAYVGATQGF